MADCNDEEIVEDLYYYIQKIKTKLDDWDIAVEEEDREGECGYTLRNDGEERQVNGVVTDMDLVLMVQDFFDVGE